MSEAKPRLSPLEVWIVSQPIGLYGKDRLEQGALKLLEVAEQEQRMPFLSAESEEHAKGFTAGQRSLIKFMKRWCGREAKS